jgi:hypothetical protein
VARDITEDIPVNIGNPGTTGFWNNTAEAYDIAVGGMPFFLVPTDNNPYQRETAPYRKDQFDNSREPGEQSLTGWWIRSQSSFHGGNGIKFYDPSSGENTAYRFAESKGVDVFTKGEVTLLKNCTSGHNITGSLQSNGRPFQFMRSIEWNSTKGVLLHDEYDVDKIPVNDPTNPVHFIDYNAGTDSPVYAICDDGTTAYWITNTATKKTVYKKALTLTSGTAGTKMFDEIGSISNATMEYVKDRIVMCADNKVYEFAGNAVAMPTAVYTHPVTTHVYTSVTASGPAIYISGYNGIQSTIQKFTLTTAGAMPTLTSAQTAAEFPAGEVVYKIYYYLGLMVIGTSKGVRIATVNDQDGSLSYGPLVFESTQAVYDFAARDHFIWCAASVDGEPGVVRIDLSQTIENEPLRFAYANDVYYEGVTGHLTTSCAFIDGTDRIAFCTNYASSTSGYVYIEDESTLRSTGYVTTGKIRYGTLEPKNFKFIRARADVTNGSLDIQIIDDANSAFNVITYNASVGTPEAATTSIDTPQEYVSYKFTLSRSASNTSLGPIFKGYQVKALPATERQRLIQFPVWCFDEEVDRNGLHTGYEGRAWERIQELENIEKLGDIVNIQDFTTGERVQALIEKTNFVRRTPPQGGFDGFGGILTITVRTVL